MVDARARFSEINFSEFSEISEINSSKRSKGGRLPGLYICERVHFNNKEYAVITIQHKKKISDLSSMIANR